MHAFFSPFAVLALLVILGCGGKSEFAPESGLAGAGWKHGVLVGTAVEPHLLEIPEYAELLADEFSVLSTENALKWENVHPAPHQYDFKGGDKIVDFAEENGMKVRGHVLVWHFQNPSWLTEGEWTKETLSEVLEDHIKKVVGHYKGRIYAWDVVNEPIDGQSWRENLWYEVIGPEYVEMAFRWAHEADPDALLFYNDYSVAELNPKSDAAYDLISDLLAEDVPVHGVGYQLHMSMDDDFNYESLFMNVHRFKELGLKVDFTELDIRIRDEASARDLAEQAVRYSKLAEVMLASGGGSFTVWGLDDGHSWIPDFFPGYGSALLFDADYSPKPAYGALKATLVAGPVELPYRESLEALYAGRRAIPPFRAEAVVSAPEVDGTLSPGEWDGAVWYAFGYNQLNYDNQLPPADRGDCDGRWTVLYDGNRIYGAVTITDDVVRTDHPTDHENDNVEVFFRRDGTFAQLRCAVGQDWYPHSYGGERSVAWSEDGSVMEYVVELPGGNLAGANMPWNIALSDNDGGSVRDHQLYPFPGINDSWQGKNLGTIAFAGDSPAPPINPLVTPPFHIRIARSAPSSAGSWNEAAWSTAVPYPLLYDQASDAVQARPFDGRDCTGSFGLLYKGGTLYGSIRRIDDITVSNGTDGQNDAAEMILSLAGELVHVRSIVGGETEILAGDAGIEASWNADGSEWTFRVALPNPEPMGTFLGFMPVLVDADGDGEAIRLCPIPGSGLAAEGRELADGEFMSY